MSLHHSPAEAKHAGITYHLVPTRVWEAQKLNSEYRPEAYEADGFIHCTDGLDQLLAIANTSYINDSRPFTVLVLAVSEITSPVRYDDPDMLFPHIYGPLNTSAVRDELTVRRADDGMFIDFGPSTHQDSPHSL